MTEDEIAGLGTQGWFSREDFGGMQQAAAAAQACVDGKRLTPAGTSRERSVNVAVRGDSSLWLTSEDSAFSPLSAMFEALRGEMNRDAWLGLTRFDLQLAHYPGNGAAYARHRDALAGKPGRRLTAIAYLNAGWTVPDGGALRLHVDPVVDIAPLLGRLVVFLSNQVEHEVMPTWASRLAITAWYYGP